jgi:hypothetical protein
MFHGIYKRVARKVGVNGSYGESRGTRRKKFTEISKATHNELRAIRDYLNRSAKKLNGG